MRSRVFVAFEKEAGVLLLLLAASVACVLWGVNGGAYAQELRYMFFGASLQDTPSAGEILAFSPAPPAEAAALRPGTPRVPSFYSKDRRRSAGDHAGGRDDRRCARST